VNVYQGGDLIKWDKAKIGYYVGIDIAEGSVSMRFCRNCLHWFFIMFPYLLPPNHIICREQL